MLLQNHPGKGVTARLPDPTSSKSSSKTGSSNGKQADLTRPHTAHSSSGSLSQQGSVDCGLNIALGNRLLMQEQGVVLPAAVEEYMQQREALGQTCVLMGINGKVVAAMAISDPLKPEAAGVVAALQRQVSRGRGCQAVFKLFCAVLCHTQRMHCCAWGTIAARPAGKHCSCLSAMAYCWLLVAHALGINQLTAAGDQVLSTNCSAVGAEP